jgi:hypothetical protein
MNVAHRYAERYGHFVGEYLFSCDILYDLSSLELFGNLTDYKWVISYNY